MLSESARVTTAEEARFRIDDPNSRQRASRIIALDAEAEAALRRISGFPWDGAHFLCFERSLEVGAGPFQIDAVLRDVEGGEVSLSAELEGADVAVMVIAAGHDASAAASIGNACRVRNIMTTGLIVADTEADASQTLKDLRPYAAMLVVASGDEYIPEMLRALRA